MSRNIEELEKEMKVLEYFEEAKYGCVPPAEVEKDLGMKIDEIETILLRNGIHIDWSNLKEIICTGEKETRDAIGKLEERITRLKGEKEKHSFINRWFGGRDKIISHIITFFLGLIAGIILKYLFI